MASPAGVAPWGSSRMCPSARRTCRTGWRTLGRAPGVRARPAILPEKRDRITGTGSWLGNCVRDMRAKQHLPEQTFPVSRHVQFRQLCSPLMRCGDYNPAIPVVNGVRRNTETWMPKANSLYISIRAQSSRRNPYS
jgi:hypothetical protein